jgi:hypothetical protein
VSSCCGFSVQERLRFSWEVDVCKPLPTVCHAWSVSEGLPAIACRVIHRIWDPHFMS